MITAKRTRAEREALNRSFYASIVLPAIWHAAGRWAPEDVRWSAAFSEIDGNPRLHHILGKARWLRAATKPERR